MREFLQAWVDAFRERKLLVYATAIAMRALIGLAGLTFLMLALLGAIGEHKLWSQHAAPAIEPKLTHPTFVAINAAVEKTSRATPPG
jgi:uncharacterized BrkB/YihY/UPF0761 family membrane protein